MVRISQGDALLVIDLQRDFCPGGALAVPSADEILPVVDGLVRSFNRQGFPVVFSRDWHPAGHASFEAEGGSWPSHCVAGTAGAAFTPEVAVPEDAIVVSKATDPGKDAYSAFDGTGLADRLRGLCVNRLCVAGLATDYCVLESVLDGLTEGFQVILLTDAVRGVNVNPGDAEKAMLTMAEKGAVLLLSGELVF